MGGTGYPLKDCIPLKLHLLFFIEENCDLFFFVFICFLLSGKCTRLICSVMSRVCLMIFIFYFIFFYFFLGLCRKHKFGMVKIMEQRSLLAQNKVELND